MPEPVNPTSRIEERAEAVGSQPSSLTAPQSLLAAARVGGWIILAAAAVLLALSGTLNAQGILTVTPGRTVSTSAGTGVLGYSGDGGSATSASLANPNGLAYDSAGDLYLADARNNVVRMISVAGKITAVAGTGVAGFGGDGGPATAAFLDTPTGVAVDASNNIYIADSHNHRIRMVSAGTISTIAGTGVAGFSGDGAAATVATLSLPSAVAVDTSGNLYIADTNNQRIRKVAAGVISTVAGNGEELLSGDGAAALLASLDKPTGIAVDANGNLYIADSHNHRIRMVDTTGIIATVTGSGPASFAGGYAGDGASAASASLAKPTGIAVDRAGTLYIADTNNQRIRAVGGGVIAPVAGAGDQGFGGDAGPLTEAVLNAPKAVITDALGNVVIADTLNQRLRGGVAPVLTFAAQGIGVASASQTVTLANTGSGSITVAGIALSGAFKSDGTGSCAAAPITLAAGATCTEDIVFLPTTTGTLNGAVTFSGTGIVPATILLAGSASQTGATTSLAISMTPVFVGQPVTFTATVTATISSPTGTVSFFDGAALIGTAAILNGTAALTDTALSAGVHSITAVYSGDPNFTASTSAALAETVEDFTLTFAPSSTSTSSTVSVLPGHAAIFSFTLLPIDGPFSSPLTLSATGLPSGATATFAPQTVTLGAAPVSFVMTIQPAVTTASTHPRGILGGGTILLGLLLLPFARRTRRRPLGWRPLTLCIAALLSLAASGCGTNSGFFGQPQKSYTVQVIGTATGANGAILQRQTIVTLTVQ